MNHQIFVLGRISLIINDD